MARGTTRKSQSGTRKYSPLQFLVTSKSAQNKLALTVVERKHSDIFRSETVVYKVDEELEDHVCSEIQSQHLRYRVSVTLQDAQRTF